MSQVQIMRVLVNQRLTAAAEEIFGLFERTIAEYEEELCRSKEKNERQQKLLDAVLKPEVRSHSADVQQLVVVKVALENNEVECDAVKTSVGASECATSSDHKGKMQQRKGTQTEWSPSLDQEDPPEPPHIKEEQEELWTSQEGEQLQGLEEADITKFLFTPVPVKSEDDEEKPQSSQLHQRQTEQMETGADGEDCGGPEPARSSHPDPRLRPRQVCLYDSGCKTNEQQPSCSVCGKMVIHQSSLQNHMLKTHTKNESFGCSECGKVFSVKGRLKVHMRIHTGEKPYSCDVCGERFTYKETLATHVTKHTREKKCLVCGKSFRNLTRHMMSHTAEKPFSCSTCGKRFTARKSWRLHKAMHTGEKRFCCRVCDQRFTWPSQLIKHKCIGPQSSQLHQNQTEENREPQSSLTFEKNDEASESSVKPFSCSVCGKRFTRKENSKKHMVVVHTQENKFRNVSDQRFASDSQLRRHKCIGPQSSQLHQRQTEPMETGADGEDCGGPEPARNSHPDPEFGPVSEDETEDSSETDDSSDWEENSESQSASNSLQSYEKYLNEVGFNAVKTPVSFSECATSSGYLQGMHTEIQGHPYRRETI